MISQALLLISMPGGAEWILIILAIVLLFGGRKIPELMRGIGQGIREFNDAKSNVKKEIEKGMKDSPEKSATAEKSSSPEKSEESKSANH